jgi:Na+-transporting NADH:ubiquinone oxidoreductase subunit NqrA
MKLKDNMIKSFIRFFAMMVFFILLSACAEFKEAGKSIGNAAKNVTTEIGRGSRDTVHAIGRGTKRVVQSVVENPTPASK